MTSCANMDKALWGSDMPTPARCIHNQEWEKVLVAVIQEAWIGGVSTRRVDELVQVMGMIGLSQLSKS
jgi:transposase-like protein